MLDIIIITILLIALIIGSLTDLKTREVPDWLNYSLIFSGLGIRLMFSIVENNWWIILEGIVGFGIFFGLACAMFYGGQWGGGDSKLLMGMGAFLGVKFTITEMPILLSFIINLLLVGAIYGLVWSSFLAIKNRKAFKKEFKEFHDIPMIKKIRMVILGISGIALIIAVVNDQIIIRLPILALAIIITLTFYLWVYVKAVENSCMFKRIAPEKLTEGDWVAEDIFSGKKMIYSSDDLGIEKEHIEEIMKLKKKGKLIDVLVKEGIPFVPSFLFGYIATIVYGAWFIAFL